MERTLLFFLIFFTLKGAFSQSVENVNAVQRGKDIVVNYDIVNAPADALYNIKLFMSGDNGQTWEALLEEVEGDVGSGVSGGYGKSVSWETLAFNDKFSGTYKFKIVALPLKDYTEIGGIEMVYVKGGDFVMGNNMADTLAGFFDDAHTILLSDYFISKTEITLAQWIEIMGGKPYDDMNCYDCPVSGVSWWDVCSFYDNLNKNTGRNYSIPTEAQWEYAARGGVKSKNFIYAGSNNIDEVAWWEGSKGDLDVKPVKLKKPNELGIYDMSGNVWEWCMDYCTDFDIDTSTVLTDTYVDYMVDPVCFNGSDRIIRGGCYLFGENLCRVIYRGQENPANKGVLVGFRIARKIGF